MKIFTPSVVVFSPNYLPLNRISLKRAVILLVLQKAEPINFLNNGALKEFRSQKTVIQVPPIIRLYHSAERPWKIPPVSRKEILRRDENQCQYCGNRKQLTIDHVIPRSRGGKHTWNNVVIACATCNGRKGDKTPTEAKMTEAKMTVREAPGQGASLITVLTWFKDPVAPKHPTIAFAQQFWQESQLATDY